MRIERLAVMSKKEKTVMHQVQVREVEDAIGGHRDRRPGEAKGAQSFTTDH